MIELTATQDDAGVRIDRFIRKRLKRVALGGLYRLIRTGGVKINGRKCRQDSRLQTDDRVSIAVESAEIENKDAPLEQQLRELTTTPYFKSKFKVIFEDDCILVCDKPIQLVVHSGSGHTGLDTMIDLARAHTLVTSGPGVVPMLVHRLDRDTSGVIILAKTPPAARVLTEQFKERIAKKTYTAVVHGAPPQPKGTIKLNLERTFERNDGTKISVAEHGQFSQSNYKTDSRGNGLTQLSVELLTGRTHQIRVHLAHIGCPIIGDMRYGNAALDEPLWARSGLRARLCLHAAQLSLPHPLTAHPMTFSAPEPPLFAQLLHDSRG